MTGNALEMKTDFSGLWLDDPKRLRDPKHRSAMLFAIGPDRNYIVRFNLSVITERHRREFDADEIKHMEETAGDIFVSDYIATPKFIIQHPRGMEEDIQIQVSWRLEADGALVYDVHEETDYFYPATLEDLHRAGFAPRFVRQVLDEIEEQGWRYQLRCAVPGNPSSRAS